MSRLESKIIATAIREIGNHNENHPHPGRYYAGAYNWCSEFVSWVYWQAGFAFTDGSFSSTVDAQIDGSWMQRSSTRIVSWFKEKYPFSYVHRESERWHSFEPRPGDYVLIGRFGSDRLHSGIVRYEACDGTLHTIEGNNSGRPVMEFSYPMYKINETENGLANGIVHGFGDMSVIWD